MSVEAHIRVSQSLLFFKFSLLPSYISPICGSVPEFFLMRKLQSCTSVMLLMLQMADVGLIKVNKFVHTKLQREIY